MEKEEESLDS